MSEQQNMKMNVDLKSTTAIEGQDGNQIFQQGVLLRKVSKFVVGAEEDAVMPIPVFFDPSSGKVLESTVPVELREEYKDITI
ncbi:hypothetical protein N9F64_01620 [bacterium]|jgi:hypothetical protein|nr:hypothetical protein [bacterium]|tara:strand:+ start:328 stop:573 length:246 start_codon:yes stop_codon:yes gene_type:complete